MKKRDRKAERKNKIYRKLVGSKGISQRSRQIYDYHEAHLAELGANKKLVTYWQIFEAFHEDFANMVLDLNHKKKHDWKDLHTKTAVLFAKLPKILFAAFYLSVRGYYYESLATLRIAYELLLRILYIQKFPDQVDLVVMNASQKKGNQFRASQVLPHHFGVGSIPPDSDKDNLYQFLGDPLHGMVHRVLKEMTKAHREGGLVLDLGYEYDPTLYAVSMNLELVVLYYTIRTFKAIFDPVTEDLHKMNYKPLVEGIKQMKLEEHLLWVAKIVEQLESK